MLGSVKDGVKVDEEENHEFLQDGQDSSKKTEDMDNLFNKLGDPGRLQVIWFFLLVCNLFTVSPNAVVGVFFGYSPSHFCNTSLDWSDSALSNQSPGMIYSTSLNPSLAVSGVRGVDDLRDRSNLTLTSSPYSRPRNAGEVNKTSVRLGNVQYGECSVNLTFNASALSDRGQMQTVSKTCERGQWVYDLSGREATTVTDFDLVCDKRFLTDLASALYYLGVILANVTLGYASDVWGRRPVILLTIHLILLTGLGIAFANSFPLFVVLRVLMGLLSQGLQSAFSVMAIELFPVHNRGKAGPLPPVFWGLGCLYLAIIAWLLQDWRHIQLAMLIPAALSAISMWFVSESVRWLLTKGKTQRAGAVIKQISAFNKVPNPISEDGHDVLAKYKVHSEKHHSSYLALIRTPQMRRRTLCLSAALFGVNFGYYGMTYNNAELAGDRYLNFLLGSVTETMAYTAGAFTVMRFGRKRTLFCCLLVGSVCCLISGVIPRSGDINNTFVTLFSVTGRFAYAACFCASDPFTAELFPTVVRNMGVGVCNMVGRLGSAMAPLVSALRHVTFAQLPPLIFAAFAFAGAMAILLVPETRAQRLPDTVDDVERTGSATEDSNQNRAQSKSNGSQDVHLESLQQPSVA